MKTLQMHSFALHDGTQMRLRDTGAGSVAGKVIVVCLHGWAMSGVWFESLSRALALEYRVLAPDLRGHGATMSGGQHLTVELLAEDLRSLLGGLKVEQVVIIGWSMGAMIAWAGLLADRGWRVLGMVIIDMTPRILNDSSWHLGMAGAYVNSRDQATHRNDNRAWNRTCRRVAERIVAEDLLDDRRQLIADLAADAASNDACIMLDLWQSMLEQDFRQTLRQLNFPVLVAYGERSQLYSPGVSAFIVRAAPNATRVGFSRSGHSPHLEQPDQFNTLVNHFVGTCVSQGANDVSQPSA